jgi:hypothetical protein
MEGKLRLAKLSAGRRSRQACGNVGGDELSWNNPAAKAQSKAYGSQGGTRTRSVLDGLSKPRGMLLGPV